MDDNTKIAHQSKEKDIENFYKIMYGKKKMKTDKDTKNFEASYFAMCLLLPKNSFLQVVNCFGGLDKVQNDKEIKDTIARLFNVETRLISVRIYDLITRDKDILEEKRLTLNKRRDK